MISWSVSDSPVKNVEYITGHLGDGMTKTHIVKSLALKA